MPALLGLEKSVRGKCGQSEEAVHVFFDHTVRITFSCTFLMRFLVGKDMAEMSQNVSLDLVKSVGGKYRRSRSAQALVAYVCIFKICFGICA